MKKNIAIASFGVILCAFSSPAFSKSSVLAEKVNNVNGTNSKVPILLIITIGALVVAFLGIKFYKNTK